MSQSCWLVIDRCNRLGAANRDGPLMEWTDCFPPIGIAQSCPSTEEYRISKRGSKYLRTLFIQAAKVPMQPHNWSRYSFGSWRSDAAERMHRNKLAVALANKLASIAGSVLRNEKAFDTHIEPATI